jgi:serine/threonine protein kinase
MSFRGTRRFELLRKLGEGGMGLVYEAHDAERDMRVALKTLRELDASSLYRFKREFRALTDISHPNIIGFYELHSEGNDWFFTMELVDGVDFNTWVRPEGYRALKDAIDEAPTMDTRPEQLRRTVDEAIPTDRIRTPVAALVDVERLRAAVQQLAEALCALHSAGVVHRDLKPSNVRVTPKGRVVLMDFGIAAEAQVRGEEGISGTPSFMAPEQAAGDPPTPSADWYSFGVMLYMALTGRLPFAGVPEVVLMAKQASSPPPPSSMVDGVPEDLDRLCAALLEVDPERRPDGGEVLARLGIAPDGFRTESPDSSRAPFVGRDKELDELRRAFERTREGATVAAFIRGSSGMGKSTLVRKFLHEVETDPAQPIVLKGRCHERESLPYKAFDGVIDTLSHVLLRFPPEVVQPLLPEEVDLLPRLFPVLRRVPNIQRARPLGASDPQELRTLAFAALSELLRRLSKLRPVLIYIDDLQWADRDSLLLLVELLRDPDAPHLLFVAAMRAENLASEPQLQEALKEVAARHPVAQLELGPLSADEQRTLVERLLGDGAGPALDDPYWRESAGSPLFLSELVRYAREHGAEAGTRPRLEDVLFARIEQLPGQARTLLEVVAVAGEPTPLWLLGDAVGLSGEERERALSMLRVASLVRVARYGREPWLATYHDRVRETLTARLAETRLAGLHRALAENLERWEEATVDALARHWLAAGDRAQAGNYLVKAARSAAEKLAFHRAAELYRAALDAGGDDLPVAQRRQLQRARADALSLCGRGFEAAQTYRAAAEGAEPDEAADLRRRAADNLLRAGHVTDGLRALAEVMRDLGFRMPPTRGRALASLMMQRARIALRGLGYTARKEQEVPARELARVDSLYAASSGLGMIDHMRGAELQSRHLLAALALGEERAACRALAIEAVFRASFGGRHWRRAETLSREVELKARQIGDETLIGIALLAVGAVTFFSGHYRAAAQAFGDAEKTFSRGVGVEWERITARYFYVSSQLALGDLTAAAESTARFVEEAERRHDLYARNLFKTQPRVFSLLREDQPDEAEREVAGALDGWPRDTFFTAHYLELCARVIIQLYRGEHRRALDESVRALPDVRGAQLARLPWVIVDLHRHMLAAALGCGDERWVQKLIGWVESVRSPVTDGFCAYYRGALAKRAGKRDEAQQLMMTSARLFESTDMRQMANSVRYRLGETMGGGEGDKLREASVGWAKAQGVKAPEKMIGLFVPA